MHRTVLASRAVVLLLVAGGARAALAQGSSTPPAKSVRQGVYTQALAA